ncbi:uncharacterized protein LOC106960192 [Poecilia latipinna]|uniref:uncharacterized protein LOC106960192 n=1 Tax=Poecilia latipinna TaxID=48699 RepID=UPI00072E5148|nr:PREDICTED: uncharacterized protein LOC106960192 [Poecilia latipinna]
MSVDVGMDESAVLCGDGVNVGGDGINGGSDGVNGGEGESEVREREGVQGEQQVEVRGDEEHLGGGDEGEKGEVQVEEQNGAELVFGTGVAGETEDVVELEASAPLKRRSKRRNVVAAVQASKQAYKLAAERKEVSDSSDNESWFSDSSEISVSQTSCKTPRYPVESFRTFLKETKGFRGIKIESFFPDLKLFYFSARYHIRNKEVSGFAETEVFRLKKIMTKVRKQL